MTLLFHLFYPKLNFHIYINCNKGGPNGSTFALYFGRCPMFEKISDGTIKVAPLEGKRKLKNT
jgi:hypothetical protein